MQILETKMADINSMFKNEFGEEEQEQLLVEDEEEEALSSSQPNEPTSKEQDILQNMQTILTNCMELEKNVQQQFGGAFALIFEYIYTNIDVMPKVRKYNEFNNELEE